MRYRSNLAWVVSSLAFILLVVGVCGELARAQLPRTRLDTVFPPGGRAGSQVTVAIRGDLANAATELIFSHPGIESTQVIEGSTEYLTAHRRPGAFELRIGEEVPNGRYEVRALGPAGLSNPRQFVVSRLNERILEAAANDRSSPLEISIGDVVNAKARTDQRDYYRFSAAAGQAVLIQVTAARIDSQLDAGLAVYDVASGRRWQRVVQGPTTDAALMFTAPSEGEFLIEVWDRTYRGGDDYFYRLEVSERPQVDGVFPPVAQDNVEREFTIYGYNLPGGQRVSSVDSDGNLQSLVQRFTPQFSHALPFASGLANGVVAGAHLEAASLRLPVPLAGVEGVFLEQAVREVILEHGENDRAAQAQEVSVPCTVAGQFFPRRDIDWYQFQLKKGQSVWIEVASHQLGTNADPLLRLMKRKEGDGTTTLVDIASADDLDGFPNTREARRMDSGSGDAAYRLTADEDATYVVAVRDQYNASADDPRLVYRLNIEPGVPDFQLLAFAEPERHPDEKIAKPNGVSLMPGGSTVVRVRLLPLRGFDQPVVVRAENLPAGVSANPLVLNARAGEGFLVLSAEESAPVDVQAVQIVGCSQGSDGKQHTARTSTVRRAANNLDNELTDGRLSQDLLVAVVDTAVPAARLQLPVAQLETSVGGRATLPIAVRRQQAFDAEVELVALELPKGIKVESTKTTTDRAELNVHVEDGKLPPGRYTFPVAAKIKEQRPRNTVVVREAERDLEKIMKLLDAGAETLKAAGSKVEALTNQAAGIAQELGALRAQVDAAQKELAVGLESEKQIAVQLAEKISALQVDLGNASLREEVAGLEAEVQSKRSDRDGFLQRWSAAQEAVARVEQKAQQLQVTQETAQQELQSLHAKRAEAEEQKAAAEKRLSEVKKAELEQDAEFWVYSPAVQLDVLSSPISVRVPESYRVSLGEPQQIPVLIDRRFGFDGQVLVQATMSGDAKIEAAPLVLGPGQRAATLVLSPMDGAKPGVWDAEIAFKLKFNNLDISDSAKCRIEIVAK